MSRCDHAAVTLRGCRALITGGLGLIGSHIADELVRTGAADRR
jgi:nucleoside-diphosphate-sugar epimerase